jgi:hypothetical protein
MSEGFGHLGVQQIYIHAVPTRGGPPGQRGQLVPIAAWRSAAPRSSRYWLGRRDDPRHRADQRGGRRVGSGRATANWRAVVGRWEDLNSVRAWLAIGAFALLLAGLMLSS